MLVTDVAEAQLHISNELLDQLLGDGDLPELYVNGQEVRHTELSSGHYLLGAMVVADDWIELRVGGATVLSTLVTEAGLLGDIELNLLSTLASLSGVDQSGSVVDLLGVSGVDSQMLYVSGGIDAQAKLLLADQHLLTLVDQLSTLGHSPAEVVSVITANFRELFGASENLFGNNMVWLDWLESQGVDFAGSSYHFQLGSGSQLLDDDQAIDIVLTGVTEDVAHFSLSHSVNYDNLQALFGSAGGNIPDLVLPVVNLPRVSGTQQAVIELSLSKLGGATTLSVGVPVEWSSTADGAQLVTGGVAGSEITLSVQGGILGQLLPQGLTLSNVDSDVLSLTNGLNSSGALSVSLERILQAGFAQLESLGLPSDVLTELFAETQYQLTVDWLGLPVSLVNGQEINSAVIDVVFGDGQSLDVSPLELDTDAFILGSNYASLVWDAPEGLEDIDLKLSLLTQVQSDGTAHGLIAPIQVGRSDLVAIANQVESIAADLGVAGSDTLSDLRERFSVADVSDVVSLITERLNLPEVSFSFANIPQNASGSSDVTIGVGATVLGRELYVQLIAPIEWSSAEGSRGSLGLGAGLVSLAIYGAGPDVDGELGEPLYIEDLHLDNSYLINGSLDADAVNNAISLRVFDIALLGVGKLLSVAQDYSDVARDLIDRVDEVLGVSLTEMTLSEMKSLLQLVVEQTNDIHFDLSVADSSITGIPLVDQQGHVIDSVSGSLEIVAGHTPQQFVTIHDYFLDQILADLGESDLSQHQDTINEIYQQWFEAVADPFGGAHQFHAVL